MRIRHYMLATAAVVIALPAFFGASLATAQETITLNLWSRPDNSGPLRPGNIVRGAENLNAVLESEGADFRVAINVLEVPSEGGFDGDAERLLRAFAIGEGPDMFIASHAWICAFADAGNAMDLTDFIEANPDDFGDIFESLWKSVECGGQRFAVPQDAEARMFFYNKGLMRDAGYDEDFIENLDEMVLAGDITLDDFSDIAAKVVKDTSAEFGIFHRPSRGPDYLMIFQQYGNSFIDTDSGKLLLEQDKIADAYGWFARNVEIGAGPANNTSLEWDFMRDQFYTENNAFSWMYGVWDLASNAFPRGVPDDEEDFFKQFGWVAAPPAVKGGQASSLTHPIVYGVSAEGENADLAARVIAFATDAKLNTDHAVTTTHLAIRRSQLDDPRYAENWVLRLSTPLLDITKFMPNHADFGTLNQILYEGLQGVELGRLTAAEAAEFVLDEADARIPDSIMAQ